MVRLILKRRDPNSHKGDSGRVLVIGGSGRYVGAPALAALASLRSGCDLATVAAPEKTAWAINTISPDIITVKLMGENISQESIDGIMDEVKAADSLVVGPGLGNDIETIKAVGSLLRDIRLDFPSLPAVIDADALKAVASAEGVVKGAPWVLTPHAGEFSILTGRTVPQETDERIKAVKHASADLGCVILLKGRVDIISSPRGEVRLNWTGNPGMTVGGTGDVLSGIIGSLLAQKVPPFQAAWGGAWICGRAGDMCMEEKGYEFIASDLLDKIPDVFREVRRKKRGKVRSG